MLMNADWDALIGAPVERIAPTLPAPTIPPGVPQKTEPVAQTGLTKSRWLYAGVTAGVAVALFSGAWILFGKRFWRSS